MTEHTAFLLTLAALASIGIVTLVAIYREWRASERHCCAMERADAVVAGIARRRA